MNREPNIIESVEFLAADDLLVAELDKRLSFTALVDTDKSCNKYLNLCGCFGKQFDPPPGPGGASAVRG